MQEYINFLEKSNFQHGLPGYALDQNSIAAKLYFELCNRKVMFALFQKEQDNKKSQIGTYNLTERVIDSAERIQYNFTQKKLKQQKNWINCKQFILIDIDNFNHSKQNILNLAIKPQFIIANPEKPASIQLIYWLEKPVFGSSKSQTDIYNFCFNSLNKIYNADKNNIGYIAKNPFCLKNYVLINEIKQYNLLDLYKSIKNELYKSMNIEEEIETKKKNTTKRKNGKTLKLSEQDKNSRNYNLFNDLRLKAYKAISIFYDQANASELLTNYLFNQQEVKESTLETREIKDIIRSIVRYCIRNFEVTKQKNEIYSEINKSKKEKEMRNINYIKANYDVTKRFSSEEKEKIATELHVSYNTVKQYIAKARNEQKLKETTLERMLELRESKKLKWRDIAILMNKTENSLRSLYKRYKSQQC
ncbi:replication initiation protein [Gallibacterium anatis]|uniref:replication initiation protein n=1 Tax=Gallibacterium anatis TaxID=750 RepID=UPI00053173A8|nr:replication initiation protein [Gallibacterium anatis]KGQ68512.1 hypothetical protein IO47_04425 [Gallibacterium anatis]